MGVCADFDNKNRQQVLRYLTWDLICEQSAECYVYTYEK